VTDVDLTAPLTPESLGAPRSLKELIDRVSGRHLAATAPPVDSGIVDTPPYPFLGLVGQPDMKLALVLSLINPAVGGVLLVGPRGTGKTTAVRSLTTLLPDVLRSLCPNGYGCLPSDVEQGGMDAVCPDCARRYGEGEILATPDTVRLFELPLNAGLDDVVGGMDERAAAHNRFRIRRGLLAQADNQLLYIDEVNLLSNILIDAILDASAQGQYTVRRGPIAATYHSRFVLIGSMNPEEGSLRPQILDRFGLRILVDGLHEQADRLEAYRRVRAYRTNPRMTAAEFADATDLVRLEIQDARDRLAGVRIDDAVAGLGLQLIERLDVSSLRAEITLFEAARAYAASDNRSEVEPEDLWAVAAMSLRLRRSRFMTEYFKDQQGEEGEIRAEIRNLGDEIARLASGS
jgi:magnesium chelatase subunit I